MVGAEAPPIALTRSVTSKLYTLVGLPVPWATASKKFIVPTGAVGGAAIAQTGVTGDPELVIHQPRDANEFRRRTAPLHL